MIALYLTDLLLCTVIPPNQSKINKRTSLTDNASFFLLSPNWRRSLDEHHVSHSQLSFPTNQRFSDTLHDTTVPTSSYQDEPLSTFFRKHHRNSAVEKLYDNNRSRLSLRSISYGFGLAKKPRQTTEHNQIISSSNYRLPSNKIELDMNQQEIIRPNESLKRQM